MRASYGSGCPLAPILVEAAAIARLRHAPRDRVTARHAAASCQPRSLPDLYRSIRSVPILGGKLDGDREAGQGGGMPIATASAPGTPCLRVFADTLFVDDGSRRGDEVRTAMLRLDFDYGGRRFRAVDARPSSLRDPAAEAQACRMLESLGAVEL